MIFIIITIKQAEKIAKKLRSEDKKIVTTNGCFDILHTGHARYLKKAKKFGDVLIVGVNSDKSPYFKTKPGRPIINEKDRLELLDSLKPVDYVFSFSDENPISWIKKIKPDFHVKSTDSSYKIEQCVERFAVKECGGKVILLKKHKGRSTTKIIDKILKTYTGGKNEFRKKL